MTVSYPPVTRPPTVEELEALPNDARRQMARLILGGWKFDRVSGVYPAWVARDRDGAACWRRSTLLGVIYEAGWRVIRAEVVI